MAHVSVLTQESIDGLHLERDAVVVDCTLGAGGHSRAILDELGPKGRLVSLDADQTAVEAYGIADPRQTLVCSNFSHLKKVVEDLGHNSVDAILADLGWRSEQFESGDKGFSFQKDEPLLMTFGQPENYTFTAHDVINGWDEENLADIIYAYGEERAARKIASAIVEARNESEITTSGQLAAIVESAAGKYYRRSKIHPATKTFQAIRIAVNDELGVLKTLLQDGYSVLSAGGRMAIITFHSLEDRIVKQTFKSFQHDYGAIRVTKKPIISSKEEVSRNPRARSAKLRIIEKPA